MFLTRKTFLIQSLPSPNFFKPSVLGEVRVFRAFASLLFVFVCVFVFVFGIIFIFTFVIYFFFQMRNSMFNAANIFYCCEAWGNKHFEKRFNYPSIEMNLSDHTSNDSSVRVGRDNDMFAGHQELNLSVSSNDQIGKHPREELDHDLVGENQRLREENKARKQRIL